MKKREYAEAVERCIPQTPPVFHQAMSRTLEAIAPRGKGGTDLGGPLLRGSLRRDGLQRPAHGLMKDRGV